MFGSSSYYDIPPLGTTAVNPTTPTPTESDESFRRRLMYITGADLREFKGAHLDVFAAEYGLRRHVGAELEVDVKHKVKPKVHL